MKTALTVIAFTTLAGFLYILVSSVPRPDLMMVVGATVLLAFWDLFFHDRVRLRRSARKMASRDETGEGTASKGSNR